MGNKPRIVAVSVQAGAHEFRDEDAIRADVTVDGEMIVDTYGPTVEYCLIDLIERLTRQMLDLPE